MSLAGLSTFKQNLDALMDSEAFKSADDGERLRLAYALLNSRYGRGSWFGFGAVKPLPPKE